MLLKSLCILSIMATICLNAQNTDYSPLAAYPGPKPQEQIYYLDNLGDHWIHTNLDGGNSLVCKFNGVKHRIPPFSEEGGHVTGIAPFEEGLTLFAFEGPSSKPAVFQWQITDPKKKWARLGTIEDAHGLPNLMLPLQEPDSYLALAIPSGFVEADGSKASLVAKFKLKDGVFRFQACVPMTLDGFDDIAKAVPVPAPQKDGDKELQPWEKFKCVVEPAALFPTLELPAISPDYLALVATQAGVIWVFDRAKGSLRRVYDLGELKKEDLKHLKHLDHLILGAAFDPSGRLYVAKRNPELAKAAVKLSSTAKDHAEAKLSEADFKFFREQYKDIQWIALDPGLGSQKTPVSPADAPIETPNYRRQTNLQFLVTPLGQVKTNAYKNWESVKRECGFTYEGPSAEPKKAKDTVQSSGKPSPKAQPKTAKPLTDAKTAKAPVNK